MNLLFPKIAIVAMASTFSVVAFAENTVVSGSLKNGLQYHFLHVPSEKGRIDVRLQVNVGASDENGTSEIGVAHMVEHMVFRRSPAFPNGVGDTLVAQGWRRGANFNAMTNYERTLYMFSPNKGKTQLEETLKALSEMMSPHAFSAEDWQKEQQVILAEWRNGLGVNERMNRKRTEIVRSGSRQARFAIIGTQQSIENTPVSVLQNFHARWYVPNNMKLMISGDIDEKQAKSLIEQYFGKMKPATLPERTGDYYEPKLSSQNTWQIKQLQDKDSGASQIALMFRVDDTPSRDFQGISGSRERLIDRAANDILAQRIKNQQKNLPKNISNISLQKSDIGRHTVAVVLFARVLPDSHDLGLNELLKLRAQILQQPITQAEFNEWKQSFSQTVQRAKSKTTLPEPFGDAIQTVSDLIFNDKPVRTSAENAARIEPILQNLSANDLNLRVKNWFQAADKIVQMQAPSLSPLTLPTPEYVAQLADKYEQNPQPKLLPKAELPKNGQFVAPIKSGKIVAKQYDKHNHVSHWKLSNGDDVYILQNAVAGDKIHWQAIQNIGFLTAGDAAWQSQLASQIVWQSAPQGWLPETFTAWQRKNGVSLSHNHLTNQTKIDGSATTPNFTHVLQAYHAFQLTPQIGDGFRNSISDMARQIAMNEQSSRAVKENAVTTLRYGKRAFPLPNEEELNDLQENQLLEHWQTLSGSPAQHFILTAESPEKLRPLVEKFVASVPRKSFKSKENMAYLPRSGSEIQRADVNNVAQRSDVSAWAFTATKWQPETAAQVALLRDIAYEHLKKELRDKALGVYSLKFETTLNAQNNRVESELHFATTPDKADDLWRLGEKVLLDLPNTLTENDVETLRKRLIDQEKNRIKSPQTWLNRLVLSQQHFGDARYLQQMSKLPESVNLANLRETAKLLWQPENRRVLIADPSKE